MKLIYPSKLPITSLMFVVCGWIVAPALPGAFAQTKQDKPVAEVRGHALYEKDLLPQLQGEIYKIRRQEYELKLKALEDQINKTLLREEAQKHGMTEEQWLRQEVDSKVPEPTQAEMDQRLAARMFGDILQMAEGVDVSRNRAKEERLQQAREAYFEKLREQASVKIYLLPPAMDVDYDPARVRGNPDAKITMVEFSDFQCPYCLQAYTTVKSLLKKYGGKIKLAYRDLPLLELNGGVAGSADAARCAGEQGKFWEYHDLLFENQDLAGVAAFKEYAETLNLNAEQFASCLDSGKFKAAIKTDYQEAIHLGITGTPAFFINGVPINGAQPQSEFEEIIDTELAVMEQ